MDRHGQAGPTAGSRAHQAGIQHPSIIGRELDAEEIPNHYRLAFGRGQPSLPALTPGAAMSAASGGPALNGPPPGPSWFQSMDRNRDGEIAPREFLGAPALFKRLDSNSDGVLDAAEAAAAR